MEYYLKFLDVQYNKIIYLIIILMSSYVLRTTGNIELSAGSASTITLNGLSVSAPALSLTTALPVLSGRNSVKNYIIWYDI